MIIIFMFVLTLYNLSAPRSTLKNVLGIKPHIWKRKQPSQGASASGTRPLDSLSALAGKGNQKAVNDLIRALSTSARVGNRTTRTTLAIAGFSLLGLVLVAIFGLSGTGIRDLRTQAVAAITTLVASIAGFYFGSRTNDGKQSDTTVNAAPDTVPPTIQADTDAHAAFTIGTVGAYRPRIAGNPSPTVLISKGSLPKGLTLDEVTGTIIGAPAPETPPGPYPVTLTATNGIDPPAQLEVNLTIQQPA